MPQHLARWFVRVLYFRTVYWLERSILGLDFTLAGRELLPETGSYIIAAKHQSAYETLKIHILFPTAAIVIKQELASIPFWGWLCVKVGGIPIDRSNGSQSMKTIKEMVAPTLARGEPILIYPQGTRVPVMATAAEYPYKPGVGLLAKTLEIPIFPMRCDSGLYWPKKGWLNKRGGVVKFEILSALNGTTKEVMAQLEEALEQPPT